MNGMCHGFVVIIFRALFEKFHLENKCSILNDICECAEDTESWCDYKYIRVLSVGMREEGAPIFYMLSSSCLVGGSWIVSYPIVCLGNCVSY